MAIAVDFETFYSKAYDVQKLGLWHYVSSPLFDAYLVGIVGEGIRFAGPPSEFDWWQLHGKHLISHNASFDAFVFAQLKLKGVIPREVRVAAWDCTANLSAYCGAPRALEKAAALLLGREVPKDERKFMCGKTWEHAVVAKKADAIKAYVLRDAETCLALWDTYASQWPEKERKLAHHTMLCGWRGVRVDSERLEQSLKTLERVMFDAANQIPWAKADTAAVLSPKALAEHCRYHNIPAPPSLSEDDPKCEEWERHYGGRFPWVAAMRDYRKANILHKKLQTMHQRTRPTDGCMGFGLKYFGSHTGRWSGDAGLNIQNLHRQAEFGVDLRRCLIARPGTQFVICDLAQIEPRVMAWLTKDHALLDQLRNGIPLYEAHARQTMGWTGGNLKKEDPRLYSLAKARVLGLGYGCGAEKFVDVARIMGGLELSLQEADAIVKAFRQSNPRIVKLWETLETAFHHSLGQTYEIELPSGRKLVYRNICSQNGWTCQTQLGGPQTKMYGGKLAENLVQAVARDVFAESLLRLIQHGVEIVFHCHDEVVCEVPEGADPVDIQRLMATTPEWLPGCPLDAEAVASPHYLK